MRRMNNLKLNQKELDLINQAKKEIADLTEQQDFIFNQLVDDILDGGNIRIKDIEKFEDYAFEYVYNSDDCDSFETYLNSFNRTNVETSASETDS